MEESSKVGSLEEGSLEVLKFGRKKGYLEGRKKGNKCGVRNFARLDI